MNIYLAEESDSIIEGRHSRFIKGILASRDKHNFTVKPII